MSSKSRHSPPQTGPRPRETIGFARKHPGSLFGVKAVGSFVPGLTRKAFEKFGFSAATLITDWHAIAGPALAAYTAPERLKWPRMADRSEEDAGSADKGRAGATLVLRVDGGRGLEVQHCARQIIERINAYFGYAAIAELRIVQAPIVLDAPRGRSGPRLPAPPLTQEVAHVVDSGLRDALARLGAEIKAGH